MKISVIAATDLALGIGYRGELPWRLPSDMQRFKRLTTGKPVIMGRRTHASIGRPLPGRTNIVLSTDPSYAPAEGCLLATSFENALSLAGAAEEAFVIGGHGLYAASLPVADTLYLTQVFGLYPADTFFPAWWTTLDWTVHVEEVLPACAFLRCERRAKNIRI